jgi:hypothetical protein
VRPEGSVHDREAEGAGHWGSAPGALCPAGARPIVSVRVGIASLQRQAVRSALSPSQRAKWSMALQAVAAASFRLEDFGVPVGAATPPQPQT